jgi:3-oxo-5-alpha-steroid 4-dehydrogenase 1
MKNKLETMEKMDTFQQWDLHKHWLAEDSAFPEYKHVFYGGLVFAAVALIGCLMMESPYGKLQAGGLIPGSLSLNPRLGWFLMELPATLSFSYFFFTSPRRHDPTALFFAALWYLHYGNRGFYFPFTIRVSPDAKANFSFLVIIAGWMFTSMHGYLSANWYGRVGMHLDHNWFRQPQFLIGLIGYQLSFWITIQSEHIQRNLRSLKPKVDEPRYKIPRGGMFEYITNPTYFFELTGWLCFAIMTSNPGGFLVFVVSCINLIPRAFQQHDWYLKTFGEDYPKNRKILIPFIL